MERLCHLLLGVSVITSDLRLKSGELKHSLRLSLRVLFLDSVCVADATVLVTCTWHPRIICQVPRDLQAVPSSINYLCLQSWLVQAINISLVACSAGTWLSFFMSRPVKPS